MGTVVEPDQHPTSSDVRGLDPYVEAIAWYISSINPSRAVSIAIEGEYGSGKTTLLSALSHTLSGLQEFVVKLDVSRAKSTEPLLAHLILSARRQLLRQLPWRVRPIRYARLVSSLATARREWFKMLKNATLLLIYMLLLWYGAAVLIHFGTIRALELGRTAMSGQSTSQAGNAKTGDTMITAVQALTAVAGPAIVLVLAIVLVKQIDKLVPFPSIRSISTSFGEEGLRQRLAFDDQGSEELASVIQSLTWRSRVCILVDGLDESDPGRMVETLGLIRWLSLRSPHPIATVACLDRMFLTAAVLASNKDLFEQMERVFCFDVSGSIDDPMYGLEGNKAFDHREDKRLTMVQAFLERLFDVSFALPRLATPAIKETLLDGGSMCEGRAEKVVHYGIARDRMDAILRMAAKTLGNNIGRMRAFVGELNVLWRVLESSGKTSIGPDEDGLTPEQTAKLLLCLRCWPAIRSELYRRPGLLNELETFCAGQGNAADLSKDAVLYRWASLSGVRELLSFGVVTEGNGGGDWQRLSMLDFQERFSFAHANPEALLYIG
jgi:hypothetical protein